MLGTLIVTAMILMPAQAATSAPDEAPPAPSEQPESTSPIEDPASSSDEVAPAPEGDSAPEQEQAPEAAPAEKRIESDVPPPDAQPGLNRWATAAIQAATGCGTAVLFQAICLPCAVPPIGYCGFPLTLLVSPIVVGSAEAVVGDWLGASRGTFLWTVLSAYAGFFGAAVIHIAVVVAAAVVVGGGLTSLASQIEGLDFSSPTTITGVLVGTYGAVGATFLASLVMFVATYATVPALGYALSADDKSSSDKGFRFPGFIEPNHGGQDEAPSDAPAEVEETSLNGGSSSSFAGDSEPRDAFATAATMSY